MISVTVGALLLAGLGTYGLIRRNSVHRAETSLQTTAAKLTQTAAPLVERIADAGTPRVGVNRGQRQSGVQLQAVAALRQIQVAARLSDARLIFVRNGEVLSYAQVAATAFGARLVANESDAPTVLSLPSQLPAEQLDIPALLAGNAITARRGDTLFYVARLAKGPANTEAVIVIAQSIDSNAARRAMSSFAIAAAIALIAGVVLSTWLARRLTKPLVEIDVAARSLASGNLDTRVAVDARTEQEVADVASALNHMARELDSARRSQRTFLQAVSHDLRTPLTSIRGYAEAITDGTLDVNDDATRLRVGGILTTEAARLERLVRDLLDLSRLDSHEFALRPRPCEIVEILRHTVDGFMPQAERVGLALAFETNDAQRIDADIDPERLGQAIANLVENALKFARSRVVVNVSHRTGWLTILVSDDGQGIAPEHQAQVFDRLYTGRDASPNDMTSRPFGTGLGLAIVYELSRAMGGACTLAASSPGGTTFRLEVPR